MPNSTLLSLFQTTMQGMGVMTSGQPATVIGNTAQDVVQTLALVNSLGGELNREFDWQQARVKNIFEAQFYEYTGNTTSGSSSLTSMSSITSLDVTFAVEGAGIPQDSRISAAPSGTTVVMTREATATASTIDITSSKVLYAVPTDFDRIVDSTQWDNSRRWSMVGPLTPPMQELMRNGFISSAPRVRFWQMGGYFQIWPPLGDDDVLSYLYQSKYWILATSPATPAPTKEIYTVDTDTCIFPDPLMRALIKLKYLEAKGLDTTAVYRDFTRQLDIAKANDAGSPDLSMAPRMENVLIGWENIPDSGYGS